MCNIQWQGVKKTPFCSVMPSERIEVMHANYDTTKSIQRRVHAFFTAKLAGHFDYVKILGPFSM